MTLHRNLDLPFNTALIQWSGSSFFGFRNVWDAEQGDKCTSRCFAVLCLLLKEILFSLVCYLKKNQTKIWVIFRGVIKKQKINLKFMSKPMVCIFTCLRIHLKIVISNFGGQILTYVIYLTSFKQYQMVTRILW